MKLRNIILSALLIGPTAYSGCQFGVKYPERIPALTVSGKVINNDDYTKGSSDIIEDDFYIPDEDVVEDSIDLVPEVEDNYETNPETIEDLLLPDEVEQVVCPEFLPQELNNLVDEGGGLELHLTMTNDMEGSLGVVEPLDSVAYILSNGYLTFEPNYDFVQHPDTFRIVDLSVEYKNEYCNSFIDVGVIVSDVNRLPVPVEQDLVIYEQQNILEFGLSATDEDNDSLTFSDINYAGILGTLVVDAEPNNYEFYKFSHAHGIAIIHYTITDGYGGVVEAVQDIILKK